MRNYVIGGNPSVPILPPAIPPTIADVKPQRTRAVMAKTHDDDGMNHGSGKRDMAELNDGVDGRIELQRQPHGQPRRYAGLQLFDNLADVRIEELHRVAVQHQ